MKGGFHSVLTRKQRQMKHRAFCWGFLEIPLIESRHFVLVSQFFFDVAHKRICHKWSERRAHGNLIHLPVKISVELEKVFFFMFFLFFCFLWCKGNISYLDNCLRTLSLLRFWCFVGLCFLVNAEWDPPFTQFYNGTREQRQTYLSWNDD